jgi:hypothetical protein
MRRRARGTPSASGPAGPRAARPAVRDRHWHRERGTAVCGALAVLAALVTADWADGGLRPWRVLLWCALSLLVLAILLPARVTAGEHWLRARGLLREDRVRLDRLDAVRWSGTVAPRLVLTDTGGGRVELDPRVLLANPLLWHRIESAAHSPQVRLRRGAETLREVGARVDSEALGGWDPRVATRPPDPRTALRSFAPTRSKGVPRQRR